MRTKTLLLTAALSAAGIATSMAQVYSVNAVGYVNTTLLPGFNLVSNPLKSTEANGNQIQNLFAAVPNNTAVYKFNNGKFDIVTKDPDFGWDPAPIAAQTVEPGQGVFVRLPAGAAPTTVTFVGEVVQGQNLTVPLPVGFSIVSSIVPQEGIATALGYVPSAGDSLYFYDETAQRYTIRNWDAEFNSFDGALPVLAVGDAFFIRRQTAGTWTRNFSVNQ